MRDSLEWRKAAKGTWSFLHRWPTAPRALRALCHLTPSWTLRQLFHFVEEFFFLCNPVPTNNHCIFHRSTCCVSSLTRKSLRFLWTHPFLSSLPARHLALRRSPPISTTSPGEGLLPRFVCFFPLTFFPKQHLNKNRFIVRLVEWWSRRPAVKDGQDGQQHSSTWWTFRLWQR